MELLFITSRNTNLKGIFVHLNKEEALRLAISLMGQIKTNNPNTERVEFYPQGNKKYNYFTISVTPEPSPLNIHKILYEIAEELQKVIPEGETLYRKGIRKGMYKVYQIVSSKLR